MDQKSPGKLEKGIGFLGRFVERLIGQAKKAKGNLEVKTGLAPILSLESRLPLPKLKALIDLVGNRFIQQSLPENLKDKNILEIGEEALPFQKNLSEQKPKILCGVVVDKRLPPSVTGSSVLKGSLKALPFENQFFDCAVAHLTTPHQGDVVSVFKELGRVLTSDGLGLVVDFHPFGLYAKSGTPRLRSVQATIKGLEDYYKMCRVANLSIMDVHEGFVDDTLRNQFVSHDEIEAFREIKGTPLVLFLKVKRIR